MTVERRNRPVAPCIVFCSTLLAAFCIAWFILFTRSKTILAQTINIIGLQVINVVMVLSEGIWKSGRKSSARNEWHLIDSSSQVSARSFVIADEEDEEEDSELKSILIHPER